MLTHFADRKNTLRLVKPEKLPGKLREISVTGFSTYYFQAIMKPGAAFIVSVARGLIVSGALIMILPMLAGASALALGLVVLGSPNAYLRGVRLEDTAQGRLCAYIEPGATLLQYKHLDDGFYLVSGTLPQERFFVRLNVALDEMAEELDRYLEEALPDYVVSAWTPLPERFDRYQLIATDAGYDERDRINKMFYLYRRRG